ncbi:MAG TPA: Ig-like domain-containing protein [Gemmatimonadaceae bacterium]|nr:Ig-like domain-containing protein [Gemmatimonadaceae bacterium]
MRGPSLSGSALTIVLVLTAGCRDAIAPSDGPAARIAALSSTAAAAVVGSTPTDPLVVRVSDASDRPVRGAQVTFSVVAGNGAVSPAVATTGGDGRAATRLTLGTRAGANVVSAHVATTVQPAPRHAVFTYMGVASAATAVQLSPRPLRFPVGTDSLRLTATARDSFGNPTADVVVLASRDPTLLAIDESGVARVQRRGGTAYVVATSAAHADSTLAIVLAPGDPPCTDVALGRRLALGEVVTDIESAGDCVTAGDADAEYALIPYFASVVPGATMQIRIRGEGLAPVASGAMAERMVPRGYTRAAAEPLAIRFERALRAREAREVRGRAAGARAWYDAMRASPPGGGLSYQRAPGTARGVPRLAVGSLLALNTNASEGCTDPVLHEGRIVAITNRAIVVADTANPAGGFTDAEYQSIGTTFDTLVDAVDVGAFGTPSDIDANGRVIMFFTRAVNALTPRNASSVILGFFYSRDLLPRAAAAGACAGSNAAEMFYLLVPDPTGAVSDVRAKSLVQAVTNGTVAHEYQHLINASRRLYVNHAAEVDEEAWLNEGLSHIAEELVFYRAAGLQPRENLDGAVLDGGSVQRAFDTYMRNNAGRYRTYLRATASQGPIGITGGDDDLETRGAVWSFLRYAADRAGSTDGTFWFRLVNSQTTGLANLQRVLGEDPLPLMRAWAVSTYTDDVIAGGDARFSQASWNFRALFPALGVSFPPDDPAFERVLADRTTSTVTLNGGSVAYFRFRVRAGEEALLGISAGSQPAPATIQTALVRIH